MDQRGLTSLASPSFSAQLTTVLSFNTNLKLDPIGALQGDEAVSCVSIGQYWLVLGGTESL